MTEFIITKELLQDFCNRSLTVEEMATEITTLSGKKCSEGTVRKGCKFHGINLMKKTRKNGFSFAPLGNAIAPTVEVNSTVNSVVGEVNLPTNAEVTQEENSVDSFVNNAGIAV